MTEAHESHIRVVRDPTFVRVAADTSVVVFLGRDLEMALLAATPEIPFASGGDEAGSIEVAGTATFVETARVRIPPGAAANIAFNLLFVLRQNNLLDENTIRVNVDSILSSDSAAQGSSI